MPVLEARRTIRNLPDSCADAIGTDPLCSSGGALCGIRLKHAGSALARRPTVCEVALVDFAAISQRLQHLRSTASVPNASQLGRSNGVDHPSELLDANRLLANVTVIVFPPEQLGCLDIGHAAGRTTAVDDVEVADDIQRVGVGMGHARRYFCGRTDQAASFNQSRIAFRSAA
jgi:hypothetical protein